MQIIALMSFSYITINPVLMALMVAQATGIKEIGLRQNWGLL